MWRSHQNCTRNHCKSVRRAKLGPYKSPHHTALKSRLRDAIKNKRSGKKVIKTSDTAPIHIESDAECAICLEPLKAKNLAVTPCGHSFCFSCIAENLSRSKKCPLCRTGLAKDTKEKIEPISDWEMIDRSRDSARWAAQEMLELIREEDQEPNDNADDAISDAVSESGSNVRRDLDEIDGDENSAGFDFGEPDEVSPSTHQEANYTWDSTDASDDEENDDESDDESDDGSEIDYGDETVASYLGLNESTLSVRERKIMDVMMNFGLQVGYNVAFKYEDEE